MVPFIVVARANDISTAPLHHIIFVHQHHADRWICIERCGSLKHEIDAWIWISFCSSEYTRWSSYRSKIHFCSGTSMSRLQLVALTLGSKPPPPLNTSYYRMFVMVSPRQQFTATLWTNPEDPLLGSGRQEKPRLGPTSVVKLRTCYQQLRINCQTCYFRFV